MSHAIVQAARAWIGTPYASGLGQGAGRIAWLVRGIWREFFGAEPEVMPAYTQDWGNRRRRIADGWCRAFAAPLRRTSSRAMCWSSA